MSNIKAIISNRRGKSAADLAVLQTIADRSGLPLFLKSALPGGTLMRPGNRYARRLHPEERLYDDEAFRLLLEELRGL